MVRGNNSPILSFGSQTISQVKLEMFDAKRLHGTGFNLFHTLFIRRAN